MAPSGSIKTRILIISDTHSLNLARQSQNSIPFRRPMCAADVVIHCGDLTMRGSMKQYHITMNMLKEIDAELKLVIAGNHDSTLDREFSKTRTGRTELDESATREALNMWTGKAAANANIKYLEEGVHSFDLANSAKLRVYATPYTPTYHNWGFNYPLDFDRYNPREPVEGVNVNRVTPINPIPDFPETDVIISHGPPLHRMDRTHSGKQPGCPFLLEAVGRARPLIHCFGHIHEGWGAERVQWQDGKVKNVEKIDVDTVKACADRKVELDMSSTSCRPLEFGKETLMVNAAIVDVKYRLKNAPWVIEVDLPNSAS